MLSVPPDAPIMELRPVEGLPEVKEEV